jgi:hypothetical protein
MNILYSFNKTGFEARYWTSEIAAASGSEYKFIPFNHGLFLDPNLCGRAQLLDNLFFAKNPNLLRLYSEFERLLRETRAAAVVVDNAAPYHPDYLRNIPVHKVLRIADGPLVAYDRDFAYLHAYDQVLYHSPAYSPELDMPSKLHYCGARNFDFWPHALFDATHNSSKTETTILSEQRDIDVVFIGGLFPGKMPTLAKVKKAFGRRARLHGLANLKKNVYFNVKYGFPGWVRPARFEEYIPLYQRAKIGINVHNRGDYTVGGYRLFELPGNGVMQISDGGEYLDRFFKEDEEIVGYRNADELIDKIRYYLSNDAERERVALNGYRRVMKDHKFHTRMHELGNLVKQSMQRTNQRFCAVQDGLLA